MTRTQYEARNLVEALRVGVAPAQHVSELTIGLEEERASLIAGLNEAHAQGGAARAILGDYGFGKSHIVELTSQEALERNFLVATASLDLGELPPHRAFDIFGSLMRSLRYPDTDEQGIGPLLDAITASRTCPVGRIGRRGERSAGGGVAGAGRSHVNTPTAGMATVAHGRSSRQAHEPGHATQDPLPLHLSRRPQRAARSPICSPASA